MDISTSINCWNNFFNNRINILSFRTIMKLIEEPNAENGSFLDEFIKHLDKTE